MRVTLVGAEPEDAAPGESSASDGATLVAEVSTVPVAPPLAVRPVEDAEWTFRN